MKMAPRSPNVAGVGVGCSAPLLLYRRRWLHHPNHQQWQRTGIQFGLQRFTTRAYFLSVYLKA